MATKAPLLNYYDILGLRTDARSPEIEAAYRAGVMRFRDQPGGSEQTRRISLAYRALSNPERRREYDASLGLPPLPPEELPAMPLAQEEPAEQVAAAGAPFADEPYQRQPTYAGGDEPVGPADEYHRTDDSSGRRGRGGLLAIWAVALGLVALLAMYAAGMFDGERRMASRDNPGQATGPIAGTAPQTAGEAPAAAGAQADTGSLPDEPVPGQIDGTQLADAGGAAAATSVQSTVPRPVGTAAPVGRSEPRYYQPGSAAQGGSTATREGSQASSTDDEASAADEAADAGDDVAPPPLPPRREEPAPAPVAQAPAPDRSAQPRLVGGGLVNADNVGGRFQGTVGVRIAVGASGRPSGCQVTRSSGNAGLDSTTCRLLQQRLQFSPARDRQGNPTSSVVESTHVWGRRPRR